MAAAGLAELQLLEDRGEDVAVALDRYEREHGGTVDRWRDATRARPVTRFEQGKRVKTSIRRIPDAPDGLSRRQIRRGLQLAAQRWRAGERPPPPVVAPRADGWWSAERLPPDEPLDDLAALLSAEQRRELLGAE